MIDYARLYWKNVYFGPFQNTRTLAYILVIRVSSFQAGYTKVERFLPKNQHTQRKLLNFENWVSG